ncbi:hypothetical protein CY0110_17627 [Crocosphaera chwakensis CCY0110]|uniref:Uncharacterized protein n=1 Tax=Crocosphaera chwakensis CCY0110 TaxID=391612 RepID=A3IIK7_9CHRO|nr:hypothetical protein CY0110_17627 [Crocosphaera chwakensis CCY0110]
MFSFKVFLICYMVGLKFSSF